MEKKTVYDITLTYRYRVEAKSTEDALNKAKEYVEDNAGEAITQMTSYEVWCEEEED